MKDCDIAAVRHKRIGALLLAGMATLLGACAPRTEAKVTPYQLTASIQDLMKSEVDPAADFLWESVSTTITREGTDTKRPYSDDEWQEVRRHAITLTEATNLLIMPGRKVVADGREVEDAHVQGIQLAREIQAAIDKEPLAWASYAQALHAAGEQALKAIDARNADQLLQAGATLDAVCEACHLKYWYPGQVVPSF